MSVRESTCGMLCSKFVSYVKLARASREGGIDSSARRAVCMQMHWCRDECLRERIVRTRYKRENSDVTVVQ
jgi:hypothetical protein